MQNIEGTAHHLKKMKIFKLPFHKKTTEPVIFQYISLHIMALEGRTNDRTTGKKAHNYIGRCC